MRGYIGDCGSPRATRTAGGQDAAPFAATGKFHALAISVWAEREDRASPSTRSGVGENHVRPQGTSANVAWRDPKRGGSSDPEPRPRPLRRPVLRRHLRDHGRPYPPVRNGVVIVRGHQQRPSAPFLATRAPGSDPDRRAVLAADRRDCMAHVPAGDQPLQQAVQPLPGATGNDSRTAKVGRIRPAPGSDAVARRAKARCMTVHVTEPVPASPMRKGQTRRFYLLLSRSRPARRVLPTCRPEPSEAGDRTEPRRRIALGGFPTTGQWPRPEVRAGPSPPRCFP